MKICFIITMLSLFNLLKGQNYIDYYRLINEAEYQLDDNKIVEARETFQKAFNIESPQAKDLFQYAYCLDQLNYSKELIIDLLDSCAKLHGQPIEWMKNFGFKSEFSEKELLLIDNVEDEFYKKNACVWNAIDYFLKEDQRLRRIFVDSIMVFYSESDTEYINFFSKLIINDSIVQDSFLRYVKINGYPGEQISGSNIMVTLLLHMTCDNFDKAKPLLYEEVKKGNLAPFSYASMVDRLGCNCLKESYYYAYTIIDKSCLPSSDKIIENRNEIGLSLYYRNPRSLLSTKRQQKLILP